MPLRMWSDEALTEMAIAEAKKMFPNYDDWTRDQWMIVIGALRRAIEEGKYRKPTRL
jgi:hypothetical protein